MIVVPALHPAYGVTARVDRLVAGSVHRVGPEASSTGIGGKALNVARFVERSKADMDWVRLGEAVSLGLRFLDDVVEVNEYVVPAIREITLANRKIGLGIMGFADALILLGVRYDTESAIQWAERISAFIQQQAHAASEELAGQRGSFPNWAGSVWDTVHNRPMRNATCTTIAPTGSLSILAGCSSGIEPLYRLAYRRVVLEGQEFTEVHPLVHRLGRSQGWLDEGVTEALINGTLPSEIPGLPQSLAGVLVTAHQVTPAWHVRMQAAFQRHIDNAVSKTVNLPTEASAADVDQVFRLAYELRCKGITVYRDRSRPGQTLSQAHVKREPAAGSDATPRPRTRVTRGVTTKFHMGCGTLFVTVNRDDRGLCEVFANLGKAGGCPAQSEATCRAISAALRSGVDPHELIDQLRGIRCLSAATARKNGEVNVLSCPDAIARAIAERLERDSEDQDRTPAQQVPGRLCVACGHPLRREAGCFVCDRCYESSCG